MKFTEKTIGILKSVSLVSGLFTVIIAITIILSLFQLKSIDPLNSPALSALKAEFDKNPSGVGIAEQVRAMDLMARKAYFSSRWQVETGSYLLLAGAIIFVLAQRLITVNDKPLRSSPEPRPDITSERKSGHRYLTIVAGSVTLLAVISSFVLRAELPKPGSQPAGTVQQEAKLATPEAYQPGDINFPAFRGEGGRGIAGGNGYPLEWNGEDGTNIKWKIPIAHEGKSSPVIWGDKVFVSGASGSDFAIYCINKNSGEIIWTGSGSKFQGASAEVPESDAEAGMAVSTPALTADCICVIFGNGNLVCYNHDGTLRWGKNIGVPQTIYGYSASLQIHENILLVQYDSQDKLTLRGFDIQNGEQKWETPRQGRPVNSSPVLATFGGQVQVLINGNPNVSAYNPNTGEELWSQPGVSGDVAPSLAVNSRFVYAVTDYYKLMALKPGNNGSEVWADNTFTPDVSSPVANEKFLFLTTGSGDAACYNAEKGDTIWTHYFGDPFYASPVICDGKVWMLDRAGVMHIAEAGQALKVLASNPIGAGTDCTPAFSEKKIYIRTRSDLYCISNN